MSWVVFPLFGLLVLAAVPYRSCRLLALGALQRLVEGGLIVSIMGCLLFHCAPELAPGWVQGVAELLVSQLREDLPGFLALERVCGSPWLLLAGFCAVLGLPFRFRLAGLARRAARSEEKSARGRPAPFSVPKGKGPTLLKDLIDSPR